MYNVYKAFFTTSETLRTTQWAIPTAPRAGDLAEKRCDEHSEDPHSGLRGLVAAALTRAILEPNYQFS